jgi:glycosyltransferase involved in cell wall biosynthesis
MSAALSSVAVIVPAFNVECWISETLRSVWSLRHPMDLLEVIVVDDASTDGTVKIAQQVLTRAPFRWRVIRSSGEGPSAARNTGWRSCSAEWVQFLDADDLVTAEKLERQLGVPEARSPEVSVIYSAWQRWSQTRSGEWAASGPVECPMVGQAALEELMDGRNFIATGSQIFRRSWLERIDGFDERRTLIEDVHLALRLAIAGGRFVCAGEGKPLFFYRQREGSQSKGSRKGFLKGVFENALLVQRHWERQRGGLTIQQQNLVLHQYAMILRGARALDRALFDEVLNITRALEPGWLPLDRPGVARLSRLLGYRQAEGLAGRLVAARRWLVGW